MANKREKFIETLRHGGIIHPHSGHHELVHSALDEFERIDEPEVATEEQPAEQTSAEPRTTGKSKKGK